MTNTIIKGDVELHCDDGLGILNNISRPEIGSKKKVYKLLEKNKRSANKLHIINASLHKLKKSLHLTLRKMYTKLIESLIIASFSSLKTHNKPQIF